MISLTNKCYKVLSLLLKRPGTIVTSSFLELTATSRVRLVLLKRGALTSMDCRILLLLRLKTSIMWLLLYLRILLLIIIILLIWMWVLHHRIVLLLLGVIVSTWTSTMMLFKVNICILCSLLRHKICIDVDTDIDIIWLIHSRSLILWLVRIIAITHTVSWWIHKSTWRFIFKFL